MTRKMVPHNEYLATSLIFEYGKNLARVFASLAPFNIFVTKMESTCRVNLCLLQIPLDNNPPGREHLSSPPNPSKMSITKPAANRCESLFGNIDFSTRLNESMAIKAGKKFIKIQAGGKTNESFIQ